MASEREGQIWKLVALVALDGVLTVERFLGANLLVEQLREGGWEGNEGSAGVEDDTSVVNLSGSVAKGDCIEIDLPVGLAAEWDLGHFPSVVIFIDTAEDGLGVIAVVGVAEIEGEDGLVEEALIEHLVERRRDLVHADGVISQA